MDDEAAVAHPGHGPTTGVRRRNSGAVLFLARCGLFLFGFAGYVITGRTAKRSYNAMRNLYGPTNGLFNNAALGLLRLLKPSRSPQSVSGFLGELTVNQIHVVKNLLDKDGYAMLPMRVPLALCQQLKEFALSHPSRPVGSASMVQYTAESAGAIRYDYDESTIMQCPAACRIALDGTLAAIAAAYFGCKPILDFTAMWWATFKGRKAYSEAAQKFHFDMDRLFFLKFFVYLTEVHAQNGPHVYVSGSHGSKPRELRSPTRFEDEEVLSHYPADALKSVCGPVGMIFAADTRALHKGMPVVTGDRLVFQVQFTICKFGQNYDVPSIHLETLQQSGIALPLDRYTCRSPIVS